MDQADFAYPDATTCRRCGATITVEEIRQCQARGTGTICPTCGHRQADTARHDPVAGKGHYLTSLGPVLAEALARPR